MTRSLGLSVPISRRRRAESNPNEGVNREMLCRDIDNIDKNKRQRVLIGVDRLIKVILQEEFYRSIDEQRRQMRANMLEHILRIKGFALHERDLAR